MRREPVKPEINVTPLVDVVLVLLIIFMVVTPQLEAGAAVELPKAKNPDATTEATLDPATVSLTSNGRYFLERKELSHDALLEELKALHAREPDKKVMLKADSTVRYAAVRTMFKHCQDVGFPGVSLQVAEAKEN